MSRLRIFNREDKERLLRDVKDLRTAAEEVYEHDPSSPGENSPFHEACDELEKLLEVLTSSLAETIQLSHSPHDIEEALATLLGRNAPAITAMHVETAARLIEALTLERYGERHAGDLPASSAVMDVIDALEALFKDVELVEDDDQGRLA